MRAALIRPFAFALAVATTAVVLFGVFAAPDLLAARTEAWFNTLSVEQQGLFGSLLKLLAWGLPGLSVALFFWSRMLFGRR